MGWTLGQLRDLESDEYDELIAWARQRAEKSQGEDGSIDMDQLIDATKAKDAHGDH